MLKRFNGICAFGWAVVICAVKVCPVGAQTEDYGQWKHQSRISLNTRTTGAGVSGDIVDFPLLVRLDSTNFNFDSAGTNGEDIRFAKTDTTPLPFEIEYWSLSRKKAAIWVKLDTVYGNRDTQSFIMYWGNATAQGHSRSGAVFDTAHGFEGVWHLDEESDIDGKADVYKDATVNANDGNDYITSPNQGGIIGHGHGFDGVDDHIAVGTPNTLDLVNRDMTLSAWTNLKNTGKTSFIIGQGTDSVGKGLQLTWRANNTLHFGFWGSPNDLYSSPAAAKKWQYVSATYTHSSKTMTLFIDGQSVGTKTAAVGYSGVGVVHLGWRPYKNAGLAMDGQMDEVRISTVARSVGWVKLSYMNQRADQKLVNVHPEPVIVEQPKDSVSVFTADTARFICRATGVPPLVYEWKNPGGQIVGTGDTLRLFGSQLTDNLFLQCHVRNAFGAVRSETAKLRVLEPNEVVNPLVVEAEATAVDNVSLKITGFKSLPDSLSLIRPVYVESIGIWYSSTTYPQKPEKSSPSRKFFKLKTINATGVDTFATDVTVPPLNVSPDTAYFFVASPIWHMGPGKDSIPPFNFADGDHALMPKGTEVVNPFTISGAYSAHDTAVVNLGNVQALDTTTVDSVIVWYGFKPGDLDFSDRQFTKRYRSGTVKANAVNGVFSAVVNNTFFNMAQQTVYASAAVKKGALLGAAVHDTFSVGVPGPDNPVTLSASALSASKIILNWKWNGAAGVDSVRIGIDTSEVSRIASAFQVVSLPVTTVDTSYTVTRLTPQTSYYFGLQIRANGVWSLVTASSRASAVTLSPSGVETVDNIIKITGKDFDASKNALVVAWTIDTTGSDSLEWAVTWQLDTTTLVPPASGKSISGPVNTTSIPLGGDIVFDATYYVGLWLRKTGGNWARPTDSSLTFVVTTSDARWQVVQHAAGVDSAYAFNGRIRFYGIPAQAQSEQIVDTLDIFTVPAAALAGFTPAGEAFAFRNTAGSPPFDIAAVYPTTVEARKNDIRMYRWDGTGLVVDHESAVDTVRGVVYSNTSDFSMPFVPLLDTRNPTVVTSSNVAAPVEARKAISDNVAVSDNIRNAKWRLLYGSGGGELQEGNAGTLSGASASLTLTIPASFVYADNGVRALFIVDDGVYIDTLHLSRRVVREESDGINIEPGAWTPVHVTAELAAPSPAPIILSANAGSAGYDFFTMRMVRWLTPQGAGIAPVKAGSNWYEYGASTINHFSLVPGRVVWVKTKRTITCNFGSATTLPLTQPYEIECSPRWTDFGLPFRFEIYLRDILRASPEAILGCNIYRWKRNDAGQYSAEALRMADGSVDKKDAVLGSRFWDAFMVYNPTAAPVTLRIPPTPTELSTGTGAGKRRRLPARILATVGGSAKTAPISPVYCSFTHSASENTYAPVPPSLSPLGLAVRSETDDGRYGSVCVAASPSAEGELFALVFTNSGPVSDRILSTVTVSQSNSAATFGYSLFDPYTNTWHDNEPGPSVEIGSGGEKYRWLALGTESYRSRIKNTMATMRAGILGIAAHLPGRGLRITFRIPLTGADYIDISAFDPRGRRVRHSMLRKVRPGLNTIDWPGTPGESLGAGAYVLVMRVASPGSSGIRVLKKSFVLFR